MLLHSFFRSGAAYRVRIALNLKGLAYEVAPRNLRRNEQREPGYLTVNPQGLVPALETDDGVLTQSLAICEYLDETFPEPPLLPRDPRMRARVRAFADVIACDVHPIQNLKILKRLKDLGLSEEQVAAWAAEAIENGFDACEALIADQQGPFCFGDRPTLADVFLVPQFVNARRFGAELRWPRLQAAEAACLALPAFQQAAPDSQPDAA
jgi:maleylpyruvate isomerase